MGAGGKLVVDQKQSVQSSTFSCLLFTLKHLSDNLHTHPPSLSISCVDVWLMFDGMWKKKLVVYFGEDQSLAQVAGVGVLVFWFFLPNLLRHQLVKLATALMEAEV